MFDGLVFDPEYFRKKMVEHRQWKLERSERVRKMLAESRSGALQLGEADLASVPGLLDALNSLSGDVESFINPPSRHRFDLRRYEAHVRTHIDTIAVSLDEIPPLGKNARNDRIWRFIAIIFLAHAGLIEVWQDGTDIMVMQREANGEGQDVSGDFEELDGVEGSLGRIEA